MYTKKETLLMQTSCKKKFLPVVLGFAEESVQAFGLNQRETFSIRLAVEELYTYLCNVLESSDVEIICTNSGYFVELIFLFKGNIPLKSFNITATISPDNNEDLDEMGLLIAARMVDNFKASKNSDGNFSLKLIKEKSYPLYNLENIDFSFENSDSFTITAPKPEELKLVSKYVKYFYKNSLLPDFFSYPGKLVDMVFLGDYQALIAIDNKRQIVGAIVWHWTSDKLIEFFGPFEFKKDFEKSLKEEIIVAFIEKIAKSDAIGIYSKAALAPLPLEYFEEIGNLLVFAKDREISLPIYFRQLKEDTGRVVWTHEELKNFLMEQYQKLFLPRKVEIIHDMGETIPEFSVLSATLEHFSKTATLKPIMFGNDIENNLKAHINLLVGEKFKNIFFEIDTGISEHAYIVPSLLKNGFQPKLLLPCAGEGDIVIFQLEKVNHA